MAQNLHSSEAWEELAEDPFRGLRAGPADFSPFLFLHFCRWCPGSLRAHQTFQTPRTTEHGRGVSNPENGQESLEVRPKNPAPRN